MIPKSVFSMTENVVTLDSRYLYLSVLYQLLFPMTMSRNKERIVWGPGLEVNQEITKEGECVAEIASYTIKCHIPLHTDSGKWLSVSGLVFITTLYMSYMSTFN